MTSLRLLSLTAGWAVALSVGACAETEYELFQRLNAGEGDGDGDNVQQPAPGDGDGATSGSGGSEPVCEQDDCDVPSASGGTTVGGLGGALPSPDKCTSAVRPPLGLVQLQMKGSAQCLAAGEEILLRDEVGYELKVLPCDDVPEQYWTFFVDSGLGWEFRQESTGFNLDMQYGGATDGTPAVLFDPHALVNQQFRATLDGTGSAMRLSPITTVGKCLTQAGEGMVLQPCDPESDEQWVRVVACTP